MHALSGSLYPRITRGHAMHVHPAGGFLINRSHSQYVVTPLNLSAAKILRLCDGRHSIEEIITDQGTFFETDPTASMDQDVSSFLNEAAKRGAVDLYKSKCPSHVDTSGTFDFFLPIHFIVELTDQCNLRCRHCYRDSSPQNQTMLPTQQAFRLFDEFKRNGVSMVELSGGEPLVHPDFLPIFVRAREMFNRITVLSNGWSINERLIIELARYPDKVMVQVDLDGATPHTHDRLRGVVGAFERTLRVIKWMADRGAFVKVVMNVYPHNLDQIEAVAELAHEKGARAFSLTPILEIGRARHIQGLDHTQYLQLTDRIKDLRAKRPTFVQLSVRELHELDPSPEPHGNCGAGWRSMVLGPSGVVRPCVMLDESVLNFGNLFQTDYLSLFEKAPTSRFHSQSPPDPAACGDCSYHSFCRRCLTRPFHVIRNNASHACAWLQKSSLSPKDPPSNPS